MNEDNVYHTRIRVPRTFDGSERFEYDRDASVIQDLVNQTFGDQQLQVLHHLRCRRGTTIFSSSSNEDTEAWGFSSHLMNILF